MEGSPAEAAREHDIGVSAAGGGVAQEHVAARLVLQERQVGDIPDHDDSQSLHVAVQRQDDPVHGEADAAVVVRDELHHLPARHAGVQAADGEL